MGSKNNKTPKAQSFESRGNKRYIRLFKDMTDSNAWGDLSIYARALYVELKSKFNGANTLDISYTYKEGTELMSKKRFTDTIDELIDHGFIKLVRHSPYSQLPNIYGFSDQWKCWNTPQFECLSRPRGQPRSREK